MILMKFSIFILLAFTPKFIYGQKKMVLIVPRQVRRETAMMAPWRQFNRHPELLDNKISASIIRGSNHNPPNHLQPPYHFLNGNPRFRFNKNHALLSSHGNKPHPSGPGGALGIDDDFSNNGPVNHVLLPHGKGITYALSFGKGYVPHDALTGNTFNGVSSQDNHPSQSVSQLPAIANQNNNNHNQNNQNNFDLTAERRLEEIKSLIFKAKQLGLLGGNDDYNNNDKSVITRDVESFSSQNNYNNNYDNYNDKKGIIIRDTILYDDYNKKITELAKNWPAHIFNNNNKNMGIINVAEMAAQNGFNLPTQFLRHVNLNNAGIGNNNNLMKQNSGYAVNEHVQDIPQDYNRYKPIAKIRPNPTAVATAAAIVATGAQVVPQVPQHSQQNSHFHPGYFSLHSPAIFNK